MTNSLTFPGFPGWVATQRLLVLATEEALVMETTFQFAARKEKKLAPMSRCLAQPTQTHITHTNTKQSTPPLKYF